MDCTTVGSVQDGFGPNAVYAGMPCRASRAFGIPDAVCIFGKPWEYAHKPNWAALYVEYLCKRLTVDAAFAGRVSELHGKRLLCWCTKKARDRDTEVPCHARILTEIVELMFHERA